MKILFLLIFGTFSVNSYGQVIELAEKEFVDCDTASSVLELTSCSAYQLDQAQRKLETTYLKTLKLLDSLAIEDEKFIKELKKDKSYSTSSLNTDYRKLKKLLINSQVLFNQYARLEMSIAGEIVGIGQERSLEENRRKIQLIEQRIKDIKAVTE